MDVMQCKMHEIHEKWIRRLKFTLRCWNVMEVLYKKYYKVKNCAWLWGSIYMDDRLLAVGTYWLLTDLIRHFNFNTCQLTMNYTDRYVNRDVTENHKKARTVNGYVERYRQLNFSVLFSLFIVVPINEVQVKYLYIFV